MLSAFSSHALLCRELPYFMTESRVLGLLEVEETFSQLWVCPSHVTRLRSAQSSIRTWFSSGVDFVMVLGTLAWRHTFIDGHPGIKLGGRVLRGFLVSIWFRFVGCILLWCLKQKKNNTSCVQTAIIQWMGWGIGSINTWHYTKCIFLYFICGLSVVSWSSVTRCESVDKYNGHGLARGV